jgi:hypothetical protein
MRIVKIIGFIIILPILIFLCIVFGILYGFGCFIAVIWPQKIFRR